jgi:DNA (cytosine-5)-methyltransferase 1
MNYIELFAGCGGLSLGLESEGFKLVVANELSPMAAETFAFNHLGLDLEKNGVSEDDKIFWISSTFKRGESKARLRENPYNAAGLDGKHSDLLDLNLTEAQLRGSILVGSILDLNRVLEGNKGLAKALRNGLGKGGVDLVSGGPPCQSFSMAGLRQRSNERNSLPWAFAKFVRTVKPKIALLENVSGILRAFMVDGEKYYAWYEVAKAFAIEGYVPICLHVNAKFAGAAQNRPRFIMIGLEKSFAERVRRGNAEAAFDEALQESFEFFNLVNEGKENLDYGHLSYHDVENCTGLFDSEIFSPLVINRKSNAQLVSVKDAIDDLHKCGAPKSKYVRFINGLALSHEDKSRIKPANTELRKNNIRVQSRFRLYQLMNLISAKSRGEISEFLRTGDETVVKESSLRELSKAGWFMTVDGERVEDLPKRSMLAELVPLQTKKQTQKALLPDRPAPAALSIPDDACHYHDGVLRTLTVREMARIQSFPDWFEFRSKVTTGGQSRKFEVPQYTQVGNAVPPLLGKALGKVCKRLLELAK